MDHVEFHLYRNMNMLDCLCRGKYRPPNAPPDGEKPLYLHISAGAHVSSIDSCDY